MKNTMKELTEGMQRLCAVANRIVAQAGTSGSRPQVSRIEIDLLLDNLRKLYDVALQLGGDELPEPRPASTPEVVEEKAPVDAPKEVAKPAKDEEVHMMAMMSTMAAMAPAPAEEPEKEVKSPMPQEPEPEVEKPAEEPAQAMPSMEELEQNDNGLLFDEVIIEPEPVKTPEPVKPQEPEPAPEASHTAATQASLLDYLQPAGASRTLGEKLGGVEGGKWKEESNVMMEKKVDDLRTVININDKFSFMSELFHNNMKAYNDFIMHLNALDSRDEAMAHVKEVAQQQKWDETSVTVASFYKILDKKF